MGRIILGAVFGGLTLFAWGMVSWMVLPWHTATLRPMPREAVVVPALREGVLRTGAYYFPAMPHETDDETTMAAWMKRHEEGPLGMVWYRAEGATPMAPGVFVKGMILNVIVAALAAALLSAASARLRAYLSRVLFVSGIAVIGALISYGSLWVWMFAPTDYVVVMGADMIVGWTLMGLVMAAIVRARGAKTTVSAAG